MSYDLIGAAANDGAVVFSAGDVVPGDAGVDFGGGFGGGDGAEVEESAGEAGGVAEAGFVRDEVVGKCYYRVFRHGCCLYCDLNIYREGRF
mmetsp:Transcript_23608/g.49846  ORF Transcript_23608/g.49846 Transcript_23608/m.49846 type:complete len:91 (-) Transcript_23608:32-304(-)